MKYLDKDQRGETNADRQADREIQTKTDRQIYIFRQTGRERQRQTDR